MSTDSTSTELATREHPSTLAVHGDYWNDQQLAVLRHMGVEDAPPADLQVFHHVCTRTGLDPFARQIHMIGRRAKDQRTEQWVTKYTIQTGIDGFRLIGRRAADRARASISVDAPEWANNDGQWVPVWSPRWGVPIAARLTIRRGGEPFTAVALFDEYAQRKRDGGLTSMWAQRPAGQLAKCAEALAWRMAFPQDLAGLYTDDEMDHAREQQPEPVHQREQSGAQRMAGMLQGEQPQQQQPQQQPEPVQGTVVEQPGEQPAPQQPESGELLNPRSALGRAMFAALGELGITDKDTRLAYVSDLVGREITTSAELTVRDARHVLDTTNDTVERMRAEQAAQQQGREQ